MDMRKGALISGDSGSYSDLNRLNQLKVGDKNSDSNLRKVAQEFESLFLGEMLKSMRSATEALGKDNPMNTPEAKQYQEMYDQQLAVSMSREGGGIGLADVLLRQMSKNKPLAPARRRPCRLPSNKRRWTRLPRRRCRHRWLPGPCLLTARCRVSVASVRCGLRGP